MLRHHRKILPKDRATLRELIIPEEWPVTEDPSAFMNLILGNVRGAPGAALDHRSLPSEFESRVGISEGCFIFDFASLPLEVARSI